MRPRSLAAVGTLVTALALLDTPTAAYIKYGQFWPTTTNTISMQLQLGSSSGALINGCSSWGCAAERALGDWNQFLNRLQFSAVRNSTAAIEDGNAVNNVFYADDVYGDPWDRDTLAVTLLSFVGTRLIETDVLFNTTFNWNAYDGPLRRANLGGTLQDFQRVALHEFGHVLGLDHPDQFGQNVNAIMNSTIGDTDGLHARRRPRRLRSLCRQRERRQPAVSAAQRNAAVPNAARGEVSQRPATARRRHLCRS